MGCMPAPANVGIEVDDVLADRDRRQRRRVDLERHARERAHPSSGRPVPGTRCRPGRWRCPRQARRPRRHRAAPDRRGRAVRTRRGCPYRSRAPGPVDRRCGRTAHTTTRPRQQPDLRPPLVLLRRHQQRARRRATRTPNTIRPTRPAGTVFGSVIMKNRKISTSGEVTITRQKSNPVTGANDQRATIAVPGGGEDADANRQRDPERRGEAEEPQPPRDQQAANADDRIRGEHRQVERRPPEVERFEARRAEDEERRDQPDVRRVEDVRSAVADDVLGQEREAGHGGEDWPAVGRPGVVRLRSDHAHDQGDRAAGEHRAGGPDEASSSGRR